MLRAILSQRWKIVETRYFLATKDGMLKPLDDATEIARLQAVSTPALTATENNLKVEVKVFFPQTVDKSLMQYALRAAMHTIQHDVSKELSLDYVLFFVKANWKALAITAYKNYLRVEHGCLYFGEGIL